MRRDLANFLSAPFRFSFAVISSYFRNLPLSVGCSAFEFYAEKISISPDHAEVRIVRNFERNRELERQYAWSAQPDAGSVVCDIADAARMNRIVTGKENQRVSFNDRSFLRAALEGAIARQGNVI